MMTKLTAQEIDEILLKMEADSEEQGVRYGDLNRFDYDHLKWGYIEELDIPGVGTLRRVADFGGEGQGDDFWVVFSITDAEGGVRYFKKPGYYASYDGGYLDGDLLEVRPVERVVAFYEPVGS
jgi:hypothetical protein